MFSLEARAVTLVRRFRSCDGGKNEREQAVRGGDCGIVLVCDPVRAAQTRVWHAALSFRRLTLYSTYNFVFPWPMAFWPIGLFESARAGED